MLEALVPPGRHVVELHYWPSMFSVGIGLALGTALALVLAFVVQILSKRRRRMPRRRGPSGAGAVPGPR